MPRGCNCSYVCTYVSLCREYTATLLLTLFVGHQVGLLSSPGRPSTPVTGERSDIEVARSAALALWSCSKSKSNKMVSNQLGLLTPTKKHYSVVRGKGWSAWG